MVIAVWRRSFYVRFGTELICAGGPSIGDGPLNLTLKNASEIDWRDCFDTGAAARVKNNALLIGQQPAIALANRTVWLPPPIPAWTWHSVATGLAHIQRIISAWPVPVEGLGGFAWNATGNVHRVGVAAKPSTQALASWLRNGAEGDPPAVIGDLLGLGPGLTPSGDDFLASTLATLHAIGSCNVANALWQMLEARLDRTTLISAAHLSCAAGGAVGAKQHALLNAILDGSEGEITRALEPILQADHSSDRDGMAGMTTTLHAMHAGIVYQ